jgi:O-methyltransferase
MNRLIGEIRPYTMVPDASLELLYHQVQELVAEGIRGDLMECGVWRGGASFLMARALQYVNETTRRIWMLDSFQGLGAPAPIDGPAANAWSRDVESPQYLDNCRAEMAEVWAAARALRVESFLEVRPGWFSDSMPSVKAEGPSLALLRIDCDWYDPVLYCLQQLYDSVSEGGLIVLDDYFAWDGCAVAVHEFLGERQLSHRLETSRDRGVAWLRKV